MILIYARHVIPLFQNNANILFFSMIMPQTIQLGILNFLRANNMAFISGWSAKSPDLNPIKHLWDNLDQRVRRRPIRPSDVIQQRQAF